MKRNIRNVLHKDMNTELLLIGQVADILHVPVHRISYLFVARKIPEPLWVSNKRVFTAMDVARIAKALGISEVPE